MKTRILFIILMALLIIRYLADFSFLIQLTGALTSIGVIFITYTLILFSIFLNKEKLQELNIDKISFWIILGTCSLLAWSYLPFALGFFMFAIVGYFAIEYRKNKFEFQSSTFSIKTFAIALFMLTPLLLLILNSNLIITNEQIINAVFKATFFGVVFEEYLFRGVLWGYLRSQGVGEYKILVIQAILFWLSHYQALLDGSLSFWTTIPFAGVILGLLALRSKSLTTGIVTHFFYNFLLGFILK